MSATNQFTLPSDSERASDAHSLAKGNIAAERLYNIVHANPSVPFVDKLFASRCPRVCLPLKCQRSASNPTWADGVTSSSSAENCAVAETLLLAARRTDTPSHRTGAWKNTYRWWYGADADVDVLSVQHEVFEALGCEPRDVVRGDVNVPRVMCFVEDARNLWFFFTDGRFNFAETMSGGDGDEPLGPTPSNAPPSVSQAMQSCTQLLKSGRLVQELSSMKPLFNNNKVQVEGVSFAVRALRRHEPHDECDRTAAEAAARGAAFTRVSCSSTVPAHCVLALPAPLHHESALEADKKVLESLPVLSNEHARVLKMARGMCALRAAQSAACSDSASGETKHDDDDDDEFAEAESVLNALNEEVCKAEKNTNSKGKKTLAYEAFIDEKDVHDFMNGTLDNPRINVHIEDGGGTFHGHKKTVRGRFFDIFGEANTEVKALENEGIAAFEKNDKRAAADMANANETLRTLESMSAQGSSMRAQFESKDCFWQFRRENGETLSKIEKAHGKGTASYNQEMQSFKRKAVQRVVDAFLGDSADSERLPNAIKEMSAALRKERVQIPEIPYVCAQIGPFGNYMFSLRMDLDGAFGPGPTMEDMELGIIVSMGGAWHHENLRPNVLYAGAHSVGKSYMLQAALKTVPDGVGYSCTHETAKAGLTDEMRTNLLQVFEELPLHHIAIDAYGNPREVDSTEKDRLTNIFRTTVSIEIIKDPETGKTERKTVVYHAVEEMARLAATNSKLPEGSNAALARWIVRTVTPSTDMDHAIRPKIGALKMNNPSDETKMIVDDLKKFNTIVTLVEKCIQSKAIADVQLHAMVEMHKLLNFVTQEYKFNTEDPKMYKKIEGIARLLTVRYAVYMGACSERATHFRVHPVTKAPRRLRDVAVDMLIEIEKFLVTTREIVVYTFSLMRSEWMPTLRQEILQAIRDLYITGRKGFESDTAAGGGDASVTRKRGGARQPIHFCSPTHTDFYSYQESANLVDSSCIELKDEAGSTKLDDVAKFIARHVRGRVVEPQMVRRELIAMQSVLVTGPIWVHTAADKDKNTPPRIFEIHQNGTALQPQQTKPLFFCGRVPFATASTKLPNGAQAEGYAATSADAAMTTSHGGFGSGGGGGGQSASHVKQPQFACMIMYDALKNPADHRSIVRKAIKSLAHRHMIGDSQTFVTSLYTELDVDYPDIDHIVGDDDDDDDSPRQQQHKQRFGERIVDKPPSVKHTARPKHHLVIHEVPTLMTIEKDNRIIATMNNDRPLRPFQRVRASRLTEGARGEFGARVQYSASGETHHIPLDTDVDHLALILHQTNIGMDHDNEYHWVFMRNNLLLEARRKCAQEARPFQMLEFEELIEDYKNQWQTRYMTRSLINKCATHKFDPNDDNFVDTVNKILIQSNGRASTAINGTKLLTDREVEIRNACVEDGNFDDDYVQMNKKNADTAIFKLVDDVKDVQHVQPAANGDVTLLTSSSGTRVADIAEFKSKDFERELGTAAAAARKRKSDDVDKHTNQIKMRKQYLLQNITRMSAAAAAGSDTASASTSADTWATSSKQQRKKNYTRHSESSAQVN